MVSKYFSINLGNLAFPARIGDNRGFEGGREDLNFGSPGLYEEVCLPSRRVFQSAGRLLPLHAPLGPSSRFGSRSLYACLLRITTLHYPDPFRFDLLP